MAVPLVINCDRHGMSPWHLVCEHLVNNPAQTWNPISAGDKRDVEHDWVCNYCHKLLKTDINDSRVAESMCLICMNCVNELYSLRKQ